MGVDTVKLHSPYVDHGLADQLEKLSIMKQGIELSSGEILYEFTSGNLEGSYDSRISFRVMREEYINHNGRPELIPSPPYVVVEASLHKFFFGQNIYGDTTNFRFLVWRFIDALGVLLADDPELLPSADRWTVHRVDLAEVYALTPNAIGEFFQGISNSSFPRRSLKTAKYGRNAAYFPGTTTTLKLYHKGPEFKEHDQARVRHALTKYRHSKFPNSYHYDTNHVWVERKLRAMQRLANNRLRVEVEVHSKKFLADFEDRHPTVNEVTDQYLQAVHDREVKRLMKEGKTDMETVRTHNAVKARLNSFYAKRTANNLFSFWMQMSARGEEVTKNEYSKSQYYDNRSKLMNAAVSWNGTDVVILPDQETALPRDFFPIRTDSRLCVSRVRSGTVFDLCPTVYREISQFKQAA